MNIPSDLSSRRSSLSRAAVFGLAALGLLVFLSSQTAHADTFAGGDGSSGNPYQITTCAQLQDMSENLADSYVLNGNVDCSMTNPSSGNFDADGPWGDDNGFNPIGTSGGKFTGTFNGNGHAISGLYISRSSTSNVGLFGYTDTSAVVGDVGVTGADVLGGPNTGALFGTNTGLVSDSYTTGSVHDNGSAAGGFAGTNSGTISRSYSTATVAGTLSGSNAVGGLVGSLAGSGVIENSYARGAVSTASDYVGGLVGFTLTSTTLIDSSYATGEVGSATHSGGLIGNNFGGGTITNSFYDESSTGKSDINGGTGTTTDAMKTESTFTGASWDFTDLPIWKIDSEGVSNDGYPYLAWQSFSPFAGGSGTADDPYQITTCAQLQDMSENLADSYVLNGNVDCSATSISDTGNPDYDDDLYHDGAGFTPIGNDSTAFTGTFDGQNYTISGLFIDLPSSGKVGLFGYIGTDASVSNVHLTGMDITGGVYVGGLAGYTESPLTNASTGGSVTGTGEYYVGGLAGFTDVSASISTTSSTADVSGDNSVGGLIGYAAGAIEGSFATGTVSGTTNVGGLVGNLDHGGSLHGAITDSYSTGTVTATGEGPSDIGGFIGNDSYGVISDTYATGNVVSAEEDGSYAGGYSGGGNGASLMDSYSTGSVTVGSGWNGVGGFSGVNGGNILGSYSAGRVTAPDPTTGTVGGFMGINHATLANDSWWTGAAADAIGDTAVALLADAGYGTDEGAQSAFASTSLAVYAVGDGGWDFDATWLANDGAYPTLRAVPATTTPITLISTGYNGDGATDITQTGATLHGEIYLGPFTTDDIGTGEGLIQFGIVLNTSEPVDIEHYTGGGVGDPSVIEGNHLSFTTDVSDLTCNTTYYFRATFDIDGVVDYTFADNTLSFTTSACSSASTPPPTAPTAPSSSSSSGGSVSFAQLSGLLAPGPATDAYLASLKQTQTAAAVPGCPAGYVCTPVTRLAVPPPATSTPFTRDLTVGDTGQDVLALQKYLNTHGFPLASSGLGSPGDETTLFGALTRSALAEFQSAHDISPAAGYFGPITRAFIAGD